VKSQLTHPNVRLTRVGRFAVQDRFIGVISGLCGVAQYCCFANSIENAYTAIMERVFYHATPGGYAPPLVPDVAVVNDVLHGFRDALVARIVRTVPVDLRVYPEENYRGRKLRLYQRARDHVIARTYGEDFGKLKTFIKHEKILLKPKRLVPRVIQPRSPEYNVCVGRYIRQLEHRVYQLINQLWGGPTVMKGLNCSQQASAISLAWSSFSHPVGVMLDAVRFDQHVSVPMLQWEHSIYLEFFPPCYRPELEWLLSMQLFNRGYISCGDGSLRYRVNGCRASGDMNTAMGNVLIMCAMIHAFVTQLGVKARLINNGDDCCLIVEEGSLVAVQAGVNQFFLRLGFIIDVQGVARSLEAVQFCQTRPVYDGREWCMVRDPNVAISKDVTILKRWNPKEYHVYLRELGVAGLAAYGHMPVWSSFYRCLTRSKVVGPVSEGLLAHVRAPIFDSGLGRLASGVHHDAPITPEARTSFALAFGITPSVQVSLEKYYDSFDPGSHALQNGYAAVHLF